MSAEEKKERCLNDREIQFAREYVRNRGNAYQAAIAAGYSKCTAVDAAKWIKRGTRKNPKYKPALRAYIDSLFEEAEARKVASPAEILEFFSSVGRGEVSDTETRSGETAEIPAKLSDRMKAMETLAKLRGMFNDTGAGVASLRRAEELLGGLDDAID